MCFKRKIRINNNTQILKLQHSINVLTRISYIQEADFSIPSSQPAHTLKNWLMAASIIRLQQFHDTRACECECAEEEPRWRGNTWIMTHIPGRSRAYTVFSFYFFYVVPDQIRSDGVWLQAESDVHIVGIREPKKYKVEFGKPHALLKQFERISFDLWDRKIVDTTLKDGDSYWKSK